MKSRLNKTIAVCGFALSGLLQAGLFTSCNDDIPAESYYTFTGEMMSDFLENNPNFSLFNEIVDRANKKAYLGSRGSRTFFPAENSGVEEFLRENGYSSVQDIPALYCDTLVKTALVENRTLYTTDMSANEQLNNELDLPLVLITSSDTVDSNNVPLTIINRASALINELKNDSVENGVIHPVTKLIVPNVSGGNEFLEGVYKSEGFSIYYQALVAAGLDALLVETQDEEYETWKENYAEFHERIFSGHTYYKPKRPDHRKYGYTFMVMRDEDLFNEYPDYFSASNSMEENLSGMYHLAAELYGDDQAAKNFGLNKIVENPQPGEEGKTYKEVYWRDDPKLYSNRYNPLYMFMAYHLIDRKFASTDKMLNCWGVNPRYCNPTEWVSTALEFSSLKLERVYNYLDKNVESPGGYYINHANPSDRYGTERVRGAIITTPAVDNNALNLSFYYVDRVLAYDTEMRNVVMNNRIRTDMMTLFPEFTNNDIRLNGTFQFRNNYDESEYGEDGYNYYIPSGYLDHTTVSENTIFFVMRPHPSYWNLGGDELNFLGSSYDVEFRLPAVPEGTYEVRMGYAGMADRGIAQVYFDSIPQGIPLDLRYDGRDGRVGGIYLEGADALEGEALEDNNRTMKNNGFYRGPASVCHIRTQTSQPDFSPANVVYFNTITTTLRRTLCTIRFEPNRHHYIRVKSVWSGADRGCFMIDYIELVPIGISGAGGLGEDIY